jgi:hypothetical protein
MSSSGRGAAPARTKLTPPLTRTPAILARSTPWDKESTLSRNYKALGLARDPNGARGRLNSAKRTAAAEEEAEEVGVLLL